MSTTESGILIVIVLALVAIFAFLRFQQGVKAKIKGPGNISMESGAGNRD